MDSLAIFIWFVNFNVLHPLFNLLIAINIIFAVLAHLFFTAKIFTLFHVYQTALGVIRTAYESITNMAKVPTTSLHSLKSLFNQLYKTDAHHTTAVIDIGSGDDVAPGGKITATDIAGGGLDHDTIEGMLICTTQIDPNRSVTCVRIKGENYVGKQIGLYDQDNQYVDEYGVADFAELAMDVLPEQGSVTLEQWARTIMEKIDPARLANILATFAEFERDETEDWIGQLLNAALPHVQMWIVEKKGRYRLAC